MKQTAVEYLYNQIKSFGIDTGFLNKSFEQAKEMEKQQIIDAHLIGLITSLETEATKQAEQYYNETYGSKGSDEHIVDTNEMISSQTEISDEEIEKASKFYKWKINQTFFEEGAKWYREQLKNKHDESNNDN